MPEYVVSASAVDRPGILASLSEVLGRHSLITVGSLSTVFHGYVVLAFVVSVETDISDDVKANVEEDLRASWPEVVRIGISDALPRATGDRPAQGPSWALCCSAGVRPEVLSEVADFFAHRQGPGGAMPANIVDHHGGTANGRSWMHFKFVLHPNDNKDAFIKDFCAWAGPRGIVCDKQLEDAPDPAF